MFRVNGKPTVGLVVFQEEGANLVRLGRELRRRRSTSFATSSGPTVSIS